MNIDKLGNGIGLLYVTDSTATTYISGNITNDSDGADSVKKDALARSSEGFPISAQGLVDFGAIGINDSISSFTINAVEQIDVTSPIAITAGMEEQAAIDLASAINSYTPVSGVNYKAYVLGTDVFVQSSAEAGSSVNGHSVVITVGSPGSHTINTQNVDGGAEGDELISSVNGARYFLNATENALPNDIASPGTEEITQFVVMRGVQSQHFNQSQTVAIKSVSNLLRYDRFSVLELEATANTDLDVIQGEFANNDILVLQNKSAYTITVRDLSVSSGNIKIDPTSFGMIDDDYIIWLMYMEDDIQGMVWREIYRTPITVGANSITSTEIAASAVGTAEIDALAVTTVKIALANITNALMANDSVGTSNIIDDAVTTAKILDANVTLDKLAPNAVDSSKIANGSVTTDKILDSNVTLQKLESDLQKGFFVINASWETDYEGGILKYEFPFSLQVDKISASVKKIIEATDDATLIPKNHAGTPMTAGQIDLAAGAIIGNTFDSTPTGNNTFTANESMQVELLKNTDGGEAEVTIHYTRL
jgi:hypothetical protein